MYPTYRPHVLELLSIAHDILRAANNCFAHSTDLKLNLDIYNYFINFPTLKVAPSKLPQPILFHCHNSMSRFFYLNMHEKLALFNYLE